MNDSTLPKPAPREETLKILRAFARGYRPASRPTGNTRVPARLPISLPGEMIPC